MPTKVTIENLTQSGLRVLQDAQAQAYAELKSHLGRLSYGWAVPTKNDPDGQAFWNDLEAVEAVRAFRKASVKLSYAKHPIERKEAARRSHQEHRLKRQRQQGEYRESHRQEAIERSHKWYATNGLQALKWRREYYEEYKPKILAQTAAWTKAHPEASANWYKEHPDRAREIRRDRRAREAEAAGSYTEGEFRARCAEFRNPCFYCGRAADEAGSLTADYFIPLYKGGTDFIWNILPACRSCNSRKGNKDPEEFLTTLENELKVGQSTHTTKRLIKGGT